MVQNQFEAELKSLLKDVNSKLQGEGNRTWTYEIKRRLENLCGKFGHKSAATGVQEGYEWTYDFVSGDWSDEGLWRGGGVEDVFLVMECEWNTSEKDIMYDFQKLLLARAEYRLMIFARSGQKSLGEMKDKMIQSINSFKRKQEGDKWIIAGWNIGTGNFDLLHDYVVP